jgi:mannonate dehydratase
MKMTFRWYGEGDSIPLSYIKQIPCVTGVVTAVYDIKAGEVWKEESIERLRAACDAAGLEMEVIESVPVHEDIKLGLSTRDRLIENYAQTIWNLGKAGVKCICYNFMPVFDWLRTDLKTKAPDGSTSLSYDHARLAAMDKYDLHLPGWDESYESGELAALLKAYEGVSHEALFDNLVYFLRGIMDACEETGINMAIHPDDPPWDMFSLPRIVTDEEHLDRLFEAVPQINNGITFCTGSLGAKRENDLVRMAKKYADRIHFAHLRQIKYSGELDFTEAGHMTDRGDVDTYGVVRALVRAGFDGYVRPDHGRNIWGEDGKPGYGLYDRALGAMYLAGLFEAAEKEYRK